jgi:hypothetical protein
MLTFQPKKTKRMKRKNHYRTQVYAKRLKSLVVPRQKKSLTWEGFAMLEE